MTSLRSRLFFILVITTGMIWLLATIWIYIGTKRELKQVLDTRLQEAARMVSSLVRDDGLAGESAIAATPLFAAAEAQAYERQLSCQIWSLGGHLVAASSASPSDRLTEQRAGFSDSVINGEPWRVYAIEDAMKGVRVLVGDRVGLRDRLVQDLVLGLVAPGLLMLPLFAALIWLSVGRGLSPLKQIATDLKGRSADDLAPVHARPADEILPLTDALNDLFGRLDAARRHERDFTAFAAHELRTPLAGVRTQAQIALVAGSEDMRRSALDKIIQGVDRTARLISQLLLLARLDAGGTISANQAVSIGLILRDIDRERMRDDVIVEIEEDLDSKIIQFNRDNIIIALRNLHENACGHSPIGGCVRWYSDKELFLTVDDDGPGVPSDEIPRITERFYRGRGALTPGSGLGLAIVKAALDQGNASICFDSSASGGLKATIRFRS